MSKPKVQRKIQRTVSSPSCDRDDAGLWLSAPSSGPDRVSPTRVTVLGALDGRGISECTERKAEEWDRCLD
jgi:hypothetical protein